METAGKVDTPRNKNFTSSSLKPLRLVIYNDSLDYGSHEEVSCHGLEAIASDESIKPIFIYCSSNKELENRLLEIKKSTSNLELLPISFHSESFEGLKSKLSSNKVNQLAKIISLKNPNGILVIQSDLEISSLGLLAAKKLGITCISYLASPHTFEENRSKYGYIKDLFSKKFLKIPNKIIVNCDTAKSLVEARGIKQSIAVVKSCIKRFNEKYSEKDREKIRRKMRISPKKAVLGVVANLELKKYRQDFLLKSLAEHAPYIWDFHILFVGNGPDRADLGSLSRELKLRDQITFISDKDNLSTVYSIIDILVIPSKHELVPLVMIEAMLNKVPIVAPKSDGMAEFLPHEWLFKPGDNFNFVEKMQTTSIKSHNNTLEANYIRAVAEFDVDKFKKNIVDEIKSTMH